MIINLLYRTQCISVQNGRVSAIFQSRNLYYRSGLGGRGRRRRQKLAEKYFDMKSWSVFSGDLPQSSNNFGCGNPTKQVFSANVSDKVDSRTREFFKSFTQPKNSEGLMRNLKPATKAQPELSDAQTLQDFIDCLNTMLEKSNPRDIFAHLDEFVIGQGKAKRALACTVYNHYSRVLNNLKRKKLSLQEFPTSPNAKLTIEKSNILLLGPSGSGKTLMARRIAEILKVPFSMNDATTFTQAGYVGDDVEQCIARLLQSSGGDVRRAEIGIVFIDEIDKICKRSDTGMHPGSGRDVSGEGVQQALLKMLEGTTVYIPDKTNKRDENIPIDTSNILFILSGAFVGLDNVINQRTKSSEKVLGFGENVPQVDQIDINSVKEGVNESDLIKFGLIPEFVGRIPSVVTVDKLTERDLIDVLSKPKNSLVEQYSRLFSTWGVKLEFTDEALRTVARKVISRQTGARGLRSILEDTLKEPMFNAPASDIVKIRITEDLNAIYQTDTHIYQISKNGQKELGEEFRQISISEKTKHALAEALTAIYQSSPSPDKQPHAPIA